MHFKIDRAAFLNELHSLQGAVSAKQLIPVLSHLLIETKAGGITMRATDLDITVKTECAASVREDGSICLPANLLALHPARHSRRRPGRFTLRAQRREA